MLLLCQKNGFYFHLYNSVNFVRWIVDSYPMRAQETVTISKILSCKTSRAKTFLLANDPHLSFLQLNECFSISIPFSLITSHPLMIDL